GRLEFEPNPSTLLWSGSTAGPWMRVLAATGNLQAVVGPTPIDATYEVDPQDRGFLSGFPLEANYVVHLERTDAPPFQVQGAAVRWPPASEGWKRNPWFQSLGAAFGLTVLLACAWLAGWYLRPASNVAQAQRQAREFLK